MKWLPKLPGWGSPRESEAPSESPADRDDAYDIFFDCFFLPMLADGRLDSEEFVPLEAAFFGLRVDDRTSAAIVRERLLDHVQRIRHEPPRELGNSFCERLYSAWSRKIDHASGLPRITSNQREALYKWVLTTLEKSDADRAFALREREDRNCGGGGTSAARDERRYRKHFENWGIGSQVPRRVEKDAIATLFRDVAARLKSLSDEFTAVPEDAAAPGPASEPAGAPVSPTAVRPATEHSSGSPRTPAATTASPPQAAGSPTPASAASPSAAPTAPESEARATPAATPAVAVPPEPREKPLPEPPTILDADVAELMRDQPAAVADRQAAIREQGRGILAAMLDGFGDFSAPQRSPLAFSRSRTSAKGQVIVVPEAEAARVTDLWFLGDIHGDILGLDAAVRYIDSVTPGATIVFLGDLFDDHGFGYEVVLRVFELIASRPDRIGYIAGNHDVSLGMRTEPELVFSSSVSPSDFADFLNDRRDDEVMTGIGKFLVRFFEAAPRAIFLPCGLIAAHAGVPLGSRWEHIKTVADLEREDCLQDFTWTRAHERARKKIPNPNSKTSEFGFDDFTAFCEFAASTLGLKAERLVRGHDHFEGGHSLYPKWVRNQCVTINTMSRRLPRDPFGTFRRTPCLARWVPGKAPEVHRLTLPGTLIDSYYNPRTAQGEDASTAPAPVS